MPRVRTLTDPFEIAARHAHLADLFTTMAAADPAPPARVQAKARAHARATSRALRAVSRHETPDGTITIPSPDERPEIDLSGALR